MALMVDIRKVDLLCTWYVSLRKQCLYSENWVHWDGGGVQVQPDLTAQPSWKGVPWMAWILDGHRFSGF